MTQNFAATQKNLWITELSLYYSGVKRSAAYAMPTCVDERRKEIGRGKFGIVFLVAGETFSTPKEF